MYKCTMCESIYDELEEEYSFDDLLGNWTCLICDAPKNSI